MPKITAQGMKFPIKDFFNKCDQMRSFLKIWSQLLKKSLMENFIVFLLGLSKTFPPKESLVSFSNRYIQEMYKSREAYATHGTKYFFI